MLPQELELYYVIPAVRRELAMRLSKLGLTHRAISKVLGVTEACVSNYFSSKRASELKFSSKIENLIERYASMIKEERITFGDVVYKICKEFRNAKDLCILHKKLESCSNCSRCLE